MLCITAVCKTIGLGVNTVASHHQSSTAHIPSHIISITLFFAVFTLKGLIITILHQLPSHFPPYLAISYCRPQLRFGEARQKVFRSRSAQCHRCALSPLWSGRHHLPLSLPSTSRRAFTRSNRVTLGSPLVRPATSTSSCHRPSRPSPLCLHSGIWYVVFTFFLCVSDFARWPRTLIPNPTPFSQCRRPPPQWRLPQQQQPDYGSSGSSDCDAMTTGTLVTAGQHKSRPHRPEIAAS